MSAEENMECKDSETPEKQNKENEKLSRSESETSSEVANAQAMSNYFDYNDASSAQFNEKMKKENLNDSVISHSSNQSDWSNVSQLTEDLASSQSQNNNTANNLKNNHIASNDLTSNDIITNENENDNDIDNEEEGSLSPNKLQNGDKSLSNSELSENGDMMTPQRPSRHRNENEKDNDNDTPNGKNVNNMESSLGYRDNPYFCGGNTPGGNENEEDDDDTNGEAPIAAAAAPGGMMRTDEDSLDGELTPRRRQDNNNKNENDNNNCESNETSDHDCSSDYESDDDIKMNDNTDLKLHAKLHEKKNNDPYSEEGQPMENDNNNNNHNNNNDSKWTIVGVLSILIVIIGVILAILLPQLPQSTQNSNTHNHNNNRAGNGNNNNDNSNTRHSLSNSQNNNNNNKNNNKNDKNTDSSYNSNRDNNDNGFHWAYNEMGEPIMPEFKCPLTEYYVPINKEYFTIDGKQYQFDNESFSENSHSYMIDYLWAIETSSYDDRNGDFLNKIMLEDVNVPILTMYEFKDDITIAGSILHLNLFIKVTIDSIKFATKCGVKVHFHESPILGIDLGTTYSCIAYQKRPISNKITQKRETNIVIADKFRNEYCIPTAIYFPKIISNDYENTNNNNNNENNNNNNNINNNIGNGVIIGQNAIKYLANDPENVIFDIKRIIGRRRDDNTIESFNDTHSFNLIYETDSSEYPKIRIPNRNNMLITPEQALSVILAHLVEMASKEFDVPYIENVVVSVPALFHNGQKKAVRSACELVGLKAVQLVVEPTAAALAHSYESTTPKDNFKLFLTFDFGGGTLDCSVLSCAGVDCRVLGVKGNSTLGGIDFDYIIADIMMDKYKNEYQWKLNNPKMKTKFIKVAENVKKQLSQVNKYPVSMKNENGIIQKIMVTRDEFENDERTILLVDKAIELARNAVKDQELHANNVRMILMVGGTSKIPLVETKLREAFGRDDLIIAFPNDDPQLMVVKGSAIIGGSLAYDPLPASLGGGKQTQEEESGEGNDGSDSEHNTESDDSNKRDESDKFTIDATSRIVVEDVIPLSLGFSICRRDYDGTLECGIMDPIVRKNSQYPTQASEVYCQRDPNSSVATLSLYEGDNRLTKDNYFLGLLNISQIPPRSQDKCDSILVHFIIDKNGIATIEATVNNPNNKNNDNNNNNDNSTSVNQGKITYNTSLPVATDDGMFSKTESIKMTKEMISWFDNIEIQTVLINLVKQNASL